MKSSIVLGFEEIRARLIECCSSQNAKEIAAQLPIMTDIKHIAEALSETQEAVNSLQQEVEQPIGGTRDIRAGVEKSKKDMILTHAELVDLHNSLLAYERMRKFFLQKYLQYPLLTLHIQDMPQHERLLRRFHTIFDRKGMLADSASPKLAQLRHRIVQTKERLKSDLQRILQDKDNQKYFQEALVTQRNNRYVIPVKQEYRYAFDGIIHDKSATGATLYIEPMRMVQLNNDLQEALVEEEQEVQRIYRLVSEEVKSVADSLLDACRRVSHVEFVYGKAELAVAQEAVAAVLNEHRTVDLRQARHPLIAKADAVPLSIMLGKDYHILLITGSNTGGKTVTLKTLGLLALMNQAGLFIPAAQGSELPVFTNIYADIGDEQSIAESLSTFSAHMTQITAILKVVKATDLVLLDELGSGTDPEEGSALAVAILDYFRQRKPLMMVTTHYNELKNYAYHTEDVENGHVEFDEKTLQPLYRLHIGVAGSSHAFSIGQRLGLPPEIIENAKAFRQNSEHGNMESILSELNEQLHQARLKEEELAAEQEKVKRLREQIEREKHNLSEKKKKMLTKAKGEIETMKRSVRLEGEQIIKSLKESFSEKNAARRQETIQAARKGISKIAVPVLAEEEREKLAQGELAVGAHVFVTSLNAVGTVLAIQGKRIQVDVNDLTATVKESDLRQADRLEKSKAERQEKQPQTRKRSGAAVLRQQSASTEINLLGKTVDEAVIDVGRFIDQAILAAVNPVRIIHGKGTGALRAGIHAYLKSLSCVARYESGGYDEGGAGVTVVYLK